MGDVSALASCWRGSPPWTDWVLGPGSRADGGGAGAAGPGSRRDRGVAMRLSGLHEPGLSACRRMASWTRRGSGDSSTGRLAYAETTPWICPRWYAVFWSSNLSPWAVEITTTRWFERMTLRSTSFRSAASATPCGGS